MDQKYRWDYVEVAWAVDITLIDFEYQFVISTISRFPDFIFQNRPSVFIAFYASVSDGRRQGSFRCWLLASHSGHSNYDAKWLCIWSLQCGPIRICGDLRWRYDVLLDSLPIVSSGRGKDPLEVIWRTRPAAKYRVFRKHARSFYLCCKLWLSSDLRQM